MANYTMEIRQLTDNPLIGLFTFDYDFYSDNPKDKEEFEKLFTQWYYFREIGFETPERFKLKLQAKLNVIMPYYRQLALTEWDKVKTAEQMMTSKDLKETTEHIQSVTGENETESQGSSSTHQSDSMNQTSTSAGTNTTSSNGTSTSSSSSHEKQSSLADGVAKASLSDGYLTAVVESSNTTSGESTNRTDININSNDKLDTKNNSQGTAEQTGKTSGSNKQELMETTTFSSVGDVGIQTPAYAITEWRKDLININQMIIEECNDLFMKLY